MTSDQLPPMLATSRLSSVQRQSECTRLDVYFLSSKNDIELLMKSSFSGSSSSSTILF